MMKFEYKESVETAIAGVYLSTDYDESESTFTVKFEQHDALPFVAEFVWDCDHTDDDGKGVWDLSVVIHQGDCMPDAADVIAITAKCAVIADAEFKAQAAVLDAA